MKQQGHLGLLFRSTRPCHATTSASWGIPRAARAIPRSPTGQSSIAIGFGTLVILSGATW